jgi:hypothetical protein
MSSASSLLAPRASAVRPRALPAELRRAVSAAPARRVAPAPVVGPLRVRALGRKTNDQIS